MGGKRWTGGWTAIAKKRYTWKVTVVLQIKSDWQTVFHFIWKYCRKVLNQCLTQTVLYDRIWEGCEGKFSLLRRHGGVTLSNLETV